jgi:hypothetical protein
MSARRNRRPLPGRETGDVPKLALEVAAPSPKMLLFLRWPPKLPGEPVPCCGRREPNRIAPLFCLLPAVKLPLEGPSNLSA